MKIALVHDFITQLGGAEKTLAVLHEIWPDAPVYTLFYDHKKQEKYFKGWDIRVSPIQNLPFGVNKYRWYLPLMPAAVERFNLSDFDLVISDCSAYAKGVLTKPNTLHLSYIYTPTRYLWSDTYQYMDSLKGAEKVVSKIVAPILSNLRVWDRLASQRPDHLIAISDFIAKRIKHYYQRESKIIFPPVEVDQFRISDQIEDYYLIISRLAPYKKVDLAIQAFNELKLPLKIIGTGPDLKHLKKMAGPQIEFLGWVSEEQKIKYLSNCKAFIHPQEEDFGITAVESMASGRPVIAYQAGGAKETMIENQTGVFFKDQNWECLAEAVIKFDSNQFNPDQIKEHAQKFSKANFKKQIQEFVQEKLDEKDKK